MSEDTCMVCGEESTKGCHGVKEDKIYSEYYCDSCYNSKNGKKEVKDELANAV